MQRRWMHEVLRRGDVSGRFIVWVNECCESFVPYSFDEYTPIVQLEYLAISKRKILTRNAPRGPRD